MYESLESFGVPNRSLIMKEVGVLLGVWKFSRRMIAENFRYVDSNFGGEFVNSEFRLRIDRFGF